jgi:hypothetical protein
MEIPIHSPWKFSHAFAHAALKNYAPTTFIDFLISTKPSTLNGISHLMGFVIALVDFLRLHSLALLWMLLCLC